LSQNMVVCILLFRLGNTHHWRPHWPVVIEGLFFQIIEESAQRIKIALRRWIEFVIVTYRASDCEADEGCAERLCSLPRDVHAQLLGNCAPFVTAYAQS